MKRDSELLTMLPMTMTPYWIRKGSLFGYFHNAFHHHPEIQLEYIVAGSGIQIIGNTYSRFKTDDMILMGSGLPHLRKCDTIYLDPKYKSKSEIITLIFDAGLFSNTLLTFPELKNVKTLLENSKRGILIKGETKQNIVQLLQQSLRKDPIKRIGLLLEILQLISDSPEVSFILNSPIEAAFSERSTNRLSKIYTYALENFKEKITIKEIAQVANLSEHSFCRFFKNNFKHNFSSFLQELRINYASTLLVETESPISEICFESGFNNFTNFNKAFRKVHNMTPSSFRKKYQSFQLGITN